MKPTKLIIIEYVVNVYLKTLKSMTNVAINTVTAPGAPTLPTPLHKLPSQQHMVPVTSTTSYFEHPLPLEQRELSAHA